MFPLPPSPMQTRTRETCYVWLAEISHDGIYGWTHTYTTHNNFHTSTIIKRVCTQCSLGSRTSTYFMFYIRNYSAHLFFSWDFHFSTHYYLSSRPLSLSLRVYYVPSIYFPFFFLLLFLFFFFFHSRLKRNL